MNIAIITFLTTSKKAGIGVYTANLIKCLQKLDKANKYYIFTFPGNRHMFEITSPNFEEIVIDLKEGKRNFFRVKYLLWQNFSFKSWVKKYNINLAHIPSTWFPPPGIRNIMTIHDIAEFKTMRYNKLLTVVKRMMVKRSIKYCNAIVTVSEFTKSELEKLGAAKVVNTYNGFINPYESFNYNPDAALQKYGLMGKKYLLFIGTIQKHKNLISTIKAFKKFLNYHSDYKLAIIGKKDNDYPAVFSYITENNLHNNIRMLEYVSDADKLNLLKSAALLTFVSSYEGFGFPLLEAQAAGIPVIISNNSALPEIGGNPEITVAPDNLDGISELMKKIIEDENFKKSIIEKGQTNFPKYTWEKTAMKTLEVYQDVLYN